MSRDVSIWCPPILLFFCCYPMLVTLPHISSISCSNIVSLYDDHEKKTYLDSHKEGPGTSIYEVRGRSSRRSARVFFYVRALLPPLALSGPCRSINPTDFWKCWQFWKILQSCTLVTKLTKFWNCGNIYFVQRVCIDGGKHFYCNMIIALFTDRLIIALFGDNKFWFLFFFTLCLR